MTSTPTPNSDPHKAAALARAERRLGMLQALAEMGMARAADICKRSMGSPYHPELKHDPGRAYGAASRAVRLTLALERVIEDDLVALRNGAAAVTPAPAARPMDPEPTHSRPESRRPAGSCSDDEAPESDRRDRESERLVEREFDHFRLEGAFDAGVDTVRAGLCRARLHDEQGGDVRVQPDVAEAADVPAPARAKRRRFFPPPKWGGYTRAFSLEPDDDETIVPGAGLVPDNPAPDFTEAPSRPSP
jgi:hypothetical protein